MADWGRGSAVVGLIRDHVWPPEAPPPSFTAAYIGKCPTVGGEAMGTAKGYNGQVEFDGEFITIHRKGVMARASVGKGEKRFPVSSVVAVQWKPPGGLVNGYIQFTMAGGNERRASFGRQTVDAAKDENSVIVTRQQKAAFEALKAEIEAAMAARHRQPPPTAAAPPPPPSASNARLDQLRQLGELRDSGVLSDEEFEAEKAAIMGTLAPPPPGLPPPPPPPSDLPPPPGGGYF
jgi:hypothetical protein